MLDILAILLAFVAGALVACWRIPGGLVKNIWAMRGGGTGEERRR